MCGIAGQFNFAKDEPVYPETIARMARSITHRGPDDEGFFLSGAVGLGFRRLSIIDLSGGPSPKCSETWIYSTQFTSRTGTAFDVKHLQSRKCEALMAA